MVSDNPEISAFQAPVTAKLPSTAAFVADRRFPLRAGEIELDGQGRIHARSDKGPLRFGFAYRGVQFGAEVEIESEPRVKLTAELGQLPYSIEIGDGRSMIRRILAASDRVPHGHIRLSESNDMLLEAESSPPLPFTPVSLMVTLTALLLDFRPYLDLLARVLDGSWRADTAPSGSDPVSSSMAR